MGGAQAAPRAAERGQLAARHLDAWAHDGDGAEAGGSGGSGSPARHPRAEFYNRQSTTINRHIYSEAAAASDAAAAKAADRRLATGAAVGAVAVAAAAAMAAASAAAGAVAMAAAGLSRL